MVRGKNTQKNRLSKYLLLRSVNFSVTFIPTQVFCYSRASSCYFFGEERPPSLSSIFYIHIHHARFYRNVTIFLLLRHASLDGNRKAFSDRIRLSISRARLRRRLHLGDHTGGQHRQRDSASRAGRPKP